MKREIASGLCLLALFFITGCSKDDSEKDYYSGNYAFTTNSTAYPDSVIHYNGSIQFDQTSKVLTINYLKEIYSPMFAYTIYPVADDNGVLTYPGWTNPELGLFFNGNIDQGGNISFKIGQRISHGGQTFETSNTVTGKKR